MSLTKIEEYVSCILVNKRTNNCRIILPYTLSHHGESLLFDIDHNKVRSVVPMNLVTRLYLSRPSEITQAKLLPKLKKKKTNCGIIARVDIILCFLTTKTDNI